uniref:Glycos_transf_1 domain-containing protein n=1 Tax=Heterorhabditis bacteriophora TaxID=37862 RepID=A0A1I7XBW0_HETBA
MGKVDSIWGLDKKYEQKNHDEVAMIEMNSNEMLLVRKLLQEQKEHQLTRYAIDISSLSSAIVFVRPFLGFTYIVDNGILKPQKQWGGAETVLPVLLPLIVTNVLVEQKKCLGEISVEQAYPKNSKVFVMEPSWEGFGFPAIVDAIQNSGKPNCRVVVVAAIGCEPNIRRLVEKYDQLSLSWMNTFEAGRMTGINSRLLSRITGTLFLVDDKMEKENNSVSRLNIGLSLKLSKRNLEMRFGRMKARERSIIYY